MNRTKIKKYSSSIIMRKSTINEISPNTQNYTHLIITTYPYKRLLKLSESLLDLLINWFNTIKSILLLFVNCVLPILSISKMYMQAGHLVQTGYWTFPSTTLSWRKIGKTARSWRCPLGFLATVNMRPPAPRKAELQPSFRALAFP